MWLLLNFDSQTFMCYCLVHNELRVKDKLKASVIALQS